MRKRMFTVNLLSALFKNIGTFILMTRNYACPVFKNILNERKMSVAYLQ